MEVSGRVRCAHVRLRKVTLAGESDLGVIQTHTDGRRLHGTEQD